MKKSLLNKMVAGFLLTILIASCSTSSDVASNSWIQKRKYTKGYHIDKATKSKSDIVKQEEAFTAQEMVTPSQEEVTTPATTVTITPDVAENNTAIVVAPVKEKTKLKEKGLAGKVFAKADGHRAQSKEAFSNYKMSDASAVGSITPLGVDAKAELHKHLKKAILCAIIALVLSIIGAVIIAGSASRVVTSGGTVTGGGIGAGAIIAWIGWIFWVIAVVFFILWLIDILGN